MKHNRPFSWPPLPLANLPAVLLLALVYFAGGKLGLKLAFVNASASAVWPPSGIALAALLAFGYRVWPGVFLGAFLANITTAGSIATSLGIATGNTLEGVVGAWLVYKFANGPLVFNRSQDIFKFAFLAVIVSTAIGATIGVTCLVLGNAASLSQYGAIWLTWWLGDATGDIIMAPFLILWSLNPRLEWTPRQALEAAALLLSVLGLGGIVFGGLFPPLRNYPIEFVCIPLLLWPAFRFAQREAATAASLLSGIAVWGTLHGSGPFVRESPNESLLLLQAFLGVLAATAVVLAAVVYERRLVEAELVHLVDHDPVTDLLSRRRFLSDLDRQLTQVRRYGTKGAVMFLDVDHFKSVNDNLGHKAGDALLKSLSRLLRGRLRDSDVLGRLGGDEFAILLPHTDGARAEALAAELLETISSQVVPIGGRTLSVTASIGIALFPEHGASVEEMLAHSDAAMYEAKETGRNLFRVYAGGTGPKARAEKPFRNAEIVREAQETQSEEKQRKP